eukprot:TRINITY_DN8489_c0_g4_i1.p1 TRINITY_DN8489_c0_g4~~TRINITY_DN8489_c0_g4_i1.p1  ORF type:complete len:499 (+),score=54.97 TRINITY_DN8489_c0_g4_i1:85-1581(+)
MKRATASLPRLFNRSFGSKRNRSKAHICPYAASLYNLYHSLFNSQLDSICNLLPSAGFPFIESVLLVAQNSEQERDRINEEVSARLCNIKPAECTSLQELLSLSNCIGILLSNKATNHSNILSAYSILVNKAPLLSFRELQLVDGRLSVEENKNFLKDTGCEPLRNMRERFRHSDRVMKALGLVKPKNLTVDLLVTPNDSITISNDRCKIILKKYNNYDPECLTKGVDLINKEALPIISLNTRSQAGKNLLGVSEMESYFSDMKKLDKNKEISATENIVNENVEGISQIAFNDTVLLNYLALLRIHKKKFSCLFHGMTEESELVHLTSNVNNKEAKRLFLLSKYHRLCQAIIWLDEIMLENCPKCGDAITYPPEIWRCLISEAEHSQKYKIKYSANAIVNPIQSKDKLKNKIIAFVESNDYFATIKEIYNKLCLKDTPQKAKFTWIEEDPHKAATLATAFRLHKYMSLLTLASKTNPYSSMKTNTIGIERLVKNWREN